MSLKDSSGHVRLNSGAICNSRGFFVDVDFLSSSSDFTKIGPVHRNFFKFPGVSLFLSAIPSMPPSSTSKRAPSQKAQPSRKGKKAWRKNVDITPVQAGLETLREEIIQYGRPLAEKTQDELFAVDTVGSSKDEAASRGKNVKILKMDEILGRRSAVPALESGRTKRGREDRVGDGVTASKRQKMDWVSKKEVARLRNNLDKQSRLGVENIDDDTQAIDLWDTTDSNKAVQSTEDQQQRDEYIPRPAAKVAPSTLRRPPISLTKSGLPTSAIPTPSGGHSYNPTFEDWDTQLTTQGEAELLAETIRLSQEKTAAEKQARVDALAAIPDRQPGDEDPESEWEGFETEADDTELSISEMKRRKRPERKTPAQRNKLNRRKEAERQAKHETRMSDRQVRSEELVRTLISRQERSQDPEILAFHTTDDPSVLRRNPTLGPSKALIPTQPLELILPDELQDSLRRLKPEGNLLTDRFRNLLVNGKLEARRPVTYAASRKRQVKMTEKWWSKDFSIGA